MYLHKTIIHKKNQPQTLVMISDTIAAISIADMDVTVRSTGVNRY